MSAVPWCLSFLGVIFLFLGISGLAYWFIVHNEAGNSRDFKAVRSARYGLLISIVLGLIGWTALALSGYCSH